MDLFFLSLYVVSLFNYIDRGIIFTLLPNLTSEFQLTKVQEGVLVSSFMVGFTLSSLFFSLLSVYYKNGNKINFLISGYCLFIVSSVLMMSVTSVNMLFLARCISGIGEGVFQSLVPYLLTEIYGEKSGNKKLGILFTAINLGIAIGLLLGGVVNSRFYLYLAMVIFEIITGVYLFVSRNIPTEKIQGDSSELSKIKSIITNKDWIYSILIMALINYSLGTIASWIPTLYKNQYQDFISFNILSIIISLIFIICSIIGSYIGNKYSMFLVEKQGSIFPLYKFGFSINIGLLVTIYLSLIWVKNFWISIICFTTFLFFVCMICIPNSLINILVINSESRIYSNSLCIFFIHLLGDLPAPIITSYIWSKKNNLVYSLEISQISLFLSLGIYLCVLLTRKTTKKLGYLDTALLET